MTSLEALLTGIVFGLLIRDGIPGMNLSATTVVDDEGNYLNVIEIVDPLDKVRARVHIVEVVE